MSKSISVTNRLIRALKSLSHAAGVLLSGEGATFGEIALINPDCIRTASIVANERTDLVVIHRDLYNRSVSNVSFYSLILPVA